ncbi:MAG: hypothetical protein IKR41_02525, partial [Bacteroidales bacterium]|nr:hypothetical protein [Bacteroidales bacterium]
GLILLAAVVPGCTKEEITDVVNFVPIWKGSLDSAPKNPAPGWAYYDTKLGQSFIFDGTSWQLMSENGKDDKDGENGTNGTIGENGNDGTIIVWKDALENAPENPVTGWCYYNSTEKKSYMYDGTTWQMIAQDGQNGTLIVWKGALETAPENPVTGWCYYNSTDKKSFMYDGTAWQMIAQDGKDYEPPKVFEFSVSADKKVVFSSGNLLKNNNSNEYKFAANQWTLTEDGYTNTFTYNDIDNWNNKTIDGNQWYALSADEWKYLIGDGDSKRDNATNLRKWTTIDGVNGLLVLPDGCTADINSDWAILKAAGAVFLPCGTKIYGEYWSSSPLNSETARYLFFDSGGNAGVFSRNRTYRVAVRLVRSLSN